ncbi:purine-cytosine permease family protein [[Kitasatospora] papulosa]|uniref:purine-cytosine permease family protein n=1 Tax=[Kitasatospora] papulosa TaxID=1464011 RepID=UPI0038249B41
MSNPSFEVSFHDDPAVLKAAATDDFSGHVVPRSWRSSRGSLSMAWLSVFSAMFWLVFPQTLALAVGVRDTLIGMVLAAVVISVAAAIVVPYAARTGTSLAMFSRRLMGYWGGALVSLLVAVTALYYCAFETSIISIAFHEYVGTLPLPVWYLLAVAVAVALAFGGVRVWLDKFNAWLLPVYVVGIVAAVVWAVAEFGYDSAWISYMPARPVTTAGPGWVLSFSGYLSQLVFIMYLWDFARMSRTQHATYHARVTFGLPFWLVTFVLNGLAGLFLAQTIDIRGAFSETSAVFALISLMGFAGVLLVWVTQSRINTTNFYVASLNLQAFGSRALRWFRPRYVWAAVAGVLVYVLMLADVIGFLLTALNYQTVFVAAWVAIACVHIVRSRTAPSSAAADEFRPGRLTLLNPAGLTSWLCSAGVGVLLLAFAGDFGATWAIIIVLPLAAALYALLDRWQPVGRAVLIRPGDLREEVEDAWAARIKCARCAQSYVAYEMDRDPANEDRAICSLCGDTAPGFYRAAAHEAREAQAGPERSPEAAT